MAFKILGQSFTPLPPSTTSPMAVAKTPSITPLATERVRIMLGGYRKIEADDPRMFAVTLAAVLSAYPPEVQIAVTDPATGLQVSSKFPPQPAELREACESAMELIREEERRQYLERRRKQQIAEREAFEASRTAESCARILEVADKCIADLGGVPGKRRGPNHMTEAEAEKRLAMAAERAAVAKYEVSPALAANIREHSERTTSAQHYERDAL